MQKKNKNRFKNSPTMLALIWCLAVVMIGVTAIDWLNRSVLNYGLSAAAIAILIVSVFYSLTVDDR